MCIVNIYIRFVNEKGQYTRRQINLYRMFFVDCSRNSQVILMTIFIQKYYIVQTLDHLTCSKIVIMTSLYRTNKLVKLKFVCSPELRLKKFNTIFSDENVR